MYTITQYIREFVSGVNIAVSFYRRVRKYSLAKREKESRERKILRDMMYAKG